MYYIKHNRRLQNISGLGVILVGRKHRIKESSNENNSGGLDWADSNGDHLIMPFPTLSFLMLTHCLQNKVKMLACFKYPFTVLFFVISLGNHHFNHTRFLIILELTTYFHNIFRCAFTMLTSPQMPLSTLFLSKNLPNIKAHHLHHATCGASHYSVKQN